MVQITVGRNERGIALSDHEVAKRAAPGGRLPLAGAKSNASGDAKYTAIGDATPAAVAAAAERHEVRHKPALAAQRLAKGK